MTVAVPDFRVTLGDLDLTDRMRPRLISLRITERRGDEADQLDIVLDDTDGRLAIPTDGETLSVWLGWKSGSGVTPGLVDKGRFVVDEVEHSGPPDTITIRARAADFTGALATRRERSWHDTTLGAIVQEIAGNHGLALRCAPALARIAVAALSQSRESDLALLRRLGRAYDALATIKANHLLFAPIGTGTTPGGTPLPATAIRRQDGDRHSYRVERREAAGRVTAAWHDRASATQRTITIGDGDGSERRLSRVYASEEAARRAAESECRRTARAPRKLSLTLALGRLDIYPEQRLSTLGFKKEVDAISWLVSEVTYELGGNGLTTALQLELAT